MRFVTVKELSTKPKQVWDMIKSDDVVVTSNGKPMAIISGITEETVDSTLKVIKRSRFMSALDEMHDHARETGLDKMSEDEIKSVIAEIRKERSR